MTTEEKVAYLLLCGWEHKDTIPGTYKQDCRWINRSINGQYWTINDAIELQRDPNSPYIFC